jgi:hypothetical protein
MPAEWILRTHSYSQEKTDDGIQTSGSLSWLNDTPSTGFQIGDNFQPVPGGTVLKVKSIDVQSEDSGKTRFGNPIKLWRISITGDSSASDGSQTEVRYTFNISKDDRGITQTEGTMSVSNTGDTPTFSISLGGAFTVPGIGQLTCTGISGGDDFKTDGTRKWDITYSGALVAASAPVPDADPPSSEYSLNGDTARTVAGELIILRRSATPIRTGNITVYNESEAPLSTPGNSYSWGRSLTETVTQEIIKQNGVVIGSFYRHDINLEV